MNISFLHWEETVILASCSLFLLLYLFAAFSVIPHTTLHLSTTFPLLTARSYSPCLPFSLCSCFSLFSVSSFSLAIALTPSLSLFVPLAVSIRRRRVSSMVDCVRPNCCSFSFSFFVIDCCSHTNNNTAVHTGLYIHLIIWFSCH